MPNLVRLEIFKKMFRNFFEIFEISIFFYLGEDTNLFWGLGFSRHVGTII